MLPLFRGHNQNAPLDEVTPAARNSPLFLPLCPLVTEDVAITSGEYCEIDLSPGIPEGDETEFYAEPSAMRSSISTQGMQ